MDFGIGAYYIITLSLCANATKNYSQNILYAETNVIYY